MNIIFHEEYFVKWKMYVFERLKEVSGEITGFFVTWRREKRKKKQKKLRFSTLRRFFKYTEKLSSRFTVQRILIVFFVRNNWVLFFGE